MMRLAKKTLYVRSMSLTPTPPTRERVSEGSSSCHDPSASHVNSIVRSKSWVVVVSRTRRSSNAAEISASYSMVKAS